LIQPSEIGHEQKGRHDTDVCRRVDARPGHQDPIVILKDTENKPTADLIGLLEAPMATEIEGIEWRGRRRLIFETILGEVGGSWTRWKSPNLKKHLLRRGQYQPGWAPSDDDSRPSDAIARALRPIRRRRQRP
jgi:hypothetical protein